MTQDANAVYRGYMTASRARKKADHQKDLAAWDKAYNSLRVAVGDPETDEEWNLRMQRMIYAQLPQSMWPKEILP